MKSAATIALTVMVLASLAPRSWANSEPLEAPDPGCGIIGVSVKVIPPAKIGSNAADAVYFVRVVEDADRFTAESFIPSNYAMGRNVYLLNAKPGRYVAIGCRFVGNPAPVGAAAPASPGFHVGVAISPGPATVVFSKADILQTEVEVRAGAVVYMGEIKAQSSTKTRESDEAQTHYLPMISPTAAHQGFMARAFSGNLVYTAVFKSLVRGESAEADFWVGAIREDFKNEPRWTNRIAGRSISPIGGPAIRTSVGATLSSDDFLSGVCLDVNTAKARANGQPEDAEKIARLVCPTVMTDWNAHGCRESVDQDFCRKRLGSWDAALKSSGSSMLFAAAQAGQTSICSVMIAMGSDANAAVSTGWTPLMIATEQGNTEIVEILTKASGETPSKGDPATASAAPGSNP